MDPGEIVARYAHGLFPMDDDGTGELPWWTADPRAIFELDPDSLARVERKVRRSLARAEPSWEIRYDEHFETVVAACGKPRFSGDGVWLTPRMGDLYRTLSAVNIAHTFELVDRDDGTLLAGIVGVVLGRAAMLESMCHFRSHAGNVLLMRVLKQLSELGIELCDVQAVTPHTERLGAREIPQAIYEQRLAAALR